MTERDRIAFAGLMAALAQVFDADVTDARVELYFHALSDLPLEAVQAATEAATNRLKWFPKPVELRELCGAGLPDLGLVAALVVKHLRDSLCGMKDVPAPPFVALAIERLGGMRAVSDMPSGVRLAHLRQVLPGILTAATARGVALPCERDVAGLPEGYRQRITEDMAGLLEGPKEEG